MNQLQLGLLLAVQCSMGLVVIAVAAASNYGSFLWWKTFSYGFNWGWYII